MPLVSVITPAYNHERFIEQCIRSVIAQSFSDWEMIIVDDGSADNTAEIVEGIGDDRVILIRQENKGIARLGETYNAALERARGTVVGILEGDDFWPPDKLATQVSDFKSDEVVLSSGLTQILMDDGSTSITPPWTPDEDVANNRPVGRAARTMMHPDSMTFTFPVATMIRTDALRRIGGFQQPSYLPLVDYPTFLRLTIEGEWRWHNEVLGIWRRHPTSVTTSRLSEILENAYRYTFEFIREHRAELPLTDEELDEIERVWDATALMRCLLRGRMLAEEGKRAAAAQAFEQGLLYKHARRTKLLIKAFSAMSRIGLSPELIYKATGRQHWRTLITLDTGDVVVSPRDMERPRFVGRWRNG